MIFASFEQWHKKSSRQLYHIKKKDQIITANQTYVLGHPVKGFGIP